MPFQLNFRIKSPCQILSKPFYMSKNTPLTSWSLPKDWFVSSMMNKSWYMKESLEQKPDWLVDSMSFPLKNLYNSLKKVSQRFCILLKISSESRSVDFNALFINCVCMCVCVCVCVCVCQCVDCSNIVFFIPW